MVKDLSFSIYELAGSVGDFGTILPLAIALAASGALSISPMLLFLGIWFIITGFYYRYPVPIEPMKAIAVIAVAGSLSGGVIAAAGLILGIVFSSLRSPTGSTLSRSVSLRRLYGECSWASP